MIDLDSLSSARRARTRAARGGTRRTARQAAAASAARPRDGDHARARGRRGRRRGRDRVVKREHTARRRSARRSSTCASRCSTVRTWRSAARRRSACRSSTPSFNGELDRSAAETRMVQRSATRSPSRVTLRRRISARSSGATRPDDGHELVVHATSYGVDAVVRYGGWRLVSHVEQRPATQVERRSPRS